jgi:phosphoglycerate dehydrogenase-like enzyme
MPTRTLRLAPVLLSALITFTLVSIALPVRATDPEPASDIIAKLRVQEASAPVRERPRWREPHKVLLLAFGRGAWMGRQEAFATAVPRARVVVAENLDAALSVAVDADVIIGFNPEICDPRLIDRAKELRWIESLSAGVENCMAVPAVRTRNLLLTNLRGVDGAVIAEHAIALALALAHGIDVFAIDTGQGIWSREHAGRTAMQALDGKTMLVVGLGGIGTEVALKAHALGMTVVATRDGDRTRPDFVSYVGLPDELLTLAEGADVIVNAVPLTPATTGMYDAKFFAALKPTAFFINVARGKSVVTAALTSALMEKRLGGAGLDVVDPEPLPPDDPLWHAPRVILTPHISARSDLPGEARWILARENLRRYGAGEKMLSVVDLTRGY